MTCDHENDKERIEELVSQTVMDFITCVGAFTLDLMLFFGLADAVGPAAAGVVYFFASVGTIIFPWSLCHDIRHILRIANIEKGDE